MTMTKKIAIASALAAGTMFAGMATANAAAPAAPGPDDLVVGVAPGLTYVSYASGDAALFAGGAGTVLLDGTGYHVFDGSGAVVF